MLTISIITFIGLTLIVWVANTAMIFPRIPAMGWSTISAANTAKDGTGTIGTNIFTIFTADATNGSRIDSIRIKPLGTNVATVLRVFVNNGATNATASNNSLISEQTMLATTVTEVAAQTDTIIALDIVLKPGYKLNITIGTAVAAGFAVTAIGGDY